MTCDPAASRYPGVEEGRGAEDDRREVGELRGKSDYQSQLECLTLEPHPVLRVINRLLHGLVVNLQGRDLSLSGQPGVGVVQRHLPSQV